MIDFETLPGGGATTDQQNISTEYASLGVTFTLLDRITGLPIGSPKIAKVGSPATAFEGCTGSDTPHPHLGLGQSFLTDGTSITIEGDLRIDYDTPVAQCSGLILDIDCRTNGGAPCEQWTITAYDSADSVLQVVVLDGPQGLENPTCASPEAGPGDSEAFTWLFDVGTPLIESVIFRYTGVAGNVGLAFDNFSYSSLPAPLAVAATGSADTICAGESLVLSASPTGGLAPYTFQWQQEIAPSVWIDLGTGGTQQVQPSTTVTYRVTVTDAVDTEVTSADITLHTTSGGVLCSASLIVSSNLNNRIVRYSFQSQQAQVLVPTGSGGLNGTSKVVSGDDGYLYACSQNNDQVLRYHAVTGAFVDVFVSAGSGGLNLPVGLDFGPDGNLYVVSNATHSVLRYNGVTGAFIDTFVPNTSGLNSPTGLVFGPDDNLYVCSRLSHKVLHFDGTTGAALGDFVTASSGGLDKPRGLTFGPDGNLYIGEETNNSVRRFDGSTGAFIDIFVASGSGGLDRANDVAFGPDNVLYVTSFDNNMLLGYDASTGAFLGALPNELLSGPAWIAIGAAPNTSGVRRDISPTLEVSVEQNTPNPFNPWTSIAFTVPVAGPTRVTIIDVTGRQVRTLVDRRVGEGRHVIEWDGTDDAGRGAASGVYFVRVQSGEVHAARKITLLR